MQVDVVLSQTTVGALFLEGVKYLWRLIIKNPLYDFPKFFYLVAIPVMQAVAGLFLALLGIVGYALPTDWMGWARALVILVTTSLLSLLVFTDGIKPLRDYKANNTKAKVKPVKA